MDVQQAKSVLRTHLKNEPTIETPLGDLEVEDLWGEGANALVFAAQWGGDVAVKFLAEDCSSRKSRRYSRFVTEFRELVKLSHTGAVVNLYYFGELRIKEGVFPYFVMELCDGTLKDFVNEKSIKSWEDLEPILARLLQCVQIVHDHNIVHRDLKPQNILINSKGDLVLADFGIAWFDPQHYERLAETRPGDRLANREFSAPEQWRKPSGGQPLPATHPSMDIYAIGQLIQWLVTEQVHSGTGRKQLRTVHESLSTLDPVVDSMLQNDPSHRPTSIKDVVRGIRGPHNNELSYDVEREERRVYKALQRFDEALRNSFPGRRGIFKVTEPDKVRQLLQNIAILVDELDDYGLWWSRGTSHLRIFNMRELEEGVWLINKEECCVKEVWVNKLTSFHTRFHLDRQYVLLNCEPMPPFEWHQLPVEWVRAEREAAAWFRDKYITVEEYEDGAAEIDGSVVRLDDEAELRERSTVRDFMFIGTKMSAICWSGEDMSNDKVVRAIYDQLKDQGKVTPSILEPLMGLKVHPTSKMYA